MFLNGHLDSCDDKEDDTELCRIKDILLSEMYEKGTTCTIKPDSQN